MIAVTADVSERDAVNAVAESAIAKYGGFDTWVNNAGVSIYGLIDEVPVEDHRRMFETNFWGTVYGSLAALRTEVMHAELPVNVTLIKPSVIDTPYIKHARNYTHKAATLPAPVYDPVLVADGILSCATTYRRELTIGEQKVYEWLDAAFPGLADRMLAQTSVSQQQRVQSPRDVGDNLYAPAPDNEPRQRGGYEGFTVPVSPYTSIAKHPLTTLAIVGEVWIGLGP